MVGWDIYDRLLMSYSNYTSVRHRSVDIGTLNLPSLVIGPHTLTLTLEAIFSQNPTFLSCVRGQAPTKITKLHR